MKNLLKALCTAAFVATITLATAGEKPKKEIVRSEFTATLSCEKCVAKVMNTLPYSKGVKNVETDLATKSIVVEYDASKCSDEAIVESLAKIDINATPASDTSAKSCESAGCCR